MIIVIFEFTVKPGKQDLYFEIAKVMQSEVEKVDGFLGVERFQSTVKDNKFVSVSRWRDEAAVAVTEEPVVRSVLGRDPCLVADPGDSDPLLDGLVVTRGIPRGVGRYAGTARGGEGLRKDGLGRGRVGEAGEHGEGQRADSDGVPDDVHGRDLARDVPVRSPHRRDSTPLNGS